MSGIPYCDKALEVTGGCDKCAPGCRICWAIKEVWRMAHNPLQGDKWKGLVEKKNGVLNWTGKIKLFPDVLNIPLRREKPTTYFIDSKADLFHPKVPFEFIDEVFATDSLCPQHTLLIFTKRADRMLEYFTEDVGGGFNRDTFVEGQAHKILCEKMGVSDYEYHAVHFPLLNVQLILSISTQKEADEKIPIFLQIPGFHGMSIEPMLGPIKFSDDKLFCDRDPDEDSPVACVPCRCGKHWQTGNIFGQRIGCLDWVVVGGESGLGARYCPIENIRKIVKQCKAASVPVFVKQIHLNGKAKAVRDINQFPEDLRIQQYPKRR